MFNVFWADDSPPPPHRMVGRGKRATTLFKKETQENDMFSLDNIFFGKSVSGLKISCRQVTRKNQKR